MNPAKEQIEFLSLADGTRRVWGLYCREDLCVRFTLTEEMLPDQWSEAVRRVLTVCGTCQTGPSPSLRVVHKSELLYLKDNLLRD